MPELVVIGSLNWDTNIYVHHLPKPGQEVFINRLEHGPGGKGGNVAVAAARILGASHVSLIASLGKDEPGKRQLSLLKHEGVDTSLTRQTTDTGSGQAIVTIADDGNNTVTTYPGANQQLKWEDITKPETQTILANARIIVVIAPPREVARKILAEAKRLRRKIIWHPAVLTRHSIKEWISELESLDYLILNQHELSQFTNNKKLTDSLETISKLAPDTRVIVTLGNKGVAYHYKGKTEKIREINISRLGLKVVNTTGSGDAFVGAFSAYKILDKPDMEALEYANMAGALKAAKAETRGSPTKAELELNLNKYTSLQTKTRLKLSAITYASR